MSVSFCILAPPLAFVCLPTFVSVRAALLASLPARLSIPPESLSALARPPSLTSVATPIPSARQAAVPSGSCASPADAPPARSPPECPVCAGPPSTDSRGGQRHRPRLLPSPPRRQSPHPRESVYAAGLAMTSAARALSAISGKHAECRTRSAISPGTILRLACRPE